MAKQTYILNGQRDREWAIAAVHRADWGMQVRISKPTRTGEQNKLLHAVAADIANQVPWPPPPANSGVMHDVEWWKRRSTLGWMIDSKMQVEVVPSLDSQTFGLLIPHTSDLDVEECAALIEWMYSFGAENQVVFKEAKREDPPPREEER